MRRAVWIAAASLMLWPLAPEGRQQSPGLSIAQAQDLVNNRRPEELDAVKVGNLTSFPHPDDRDRRRVTEMEAILLPQFIAQGDVFKEGRYVGSKRTRLLLGGEVATFDDWSRPYFSFRGAQPIGGSERTRLQRALDGFVTAALDVRRGLPRWSPYLPARVRDFAMVSQLDGSEKESDATLSTTVTAFLDSGAWYVWLALEKPESFRRLMDEMENLADPASGPAAITAMHALLNRHRPQLVDSLRGLSPPHMQKDTAFLARVLLGSVWKMRNGDAGDLRVASFPESEDLYWVQYGLNTLLLFQWSGGALRLVNAIGISN